MSWKVAALCGGRRFGSPVRKQIIMFLADKTSDDGSGIWCSKGTIQRHTELGSSTVKRTVNDFITEGILIETGRRACKNGFTIVYRIALAAVHRLEPIEEPEDETGSAADGVQPEPETGSALDGVPGPQRTPNHPKTIHKPPTRAPTREAAAEISEILKAYPADRLRGDSDCLTEIERAAAEVGADALLAGVKRYARETANHTRSRVCLSDNWFRTGRWRNYLTPEPIPSTPPTARLRDAPQALGDHANPGLRPTPVRSSVIASKDTGVEEAPSPVQLLGRDIDTRIGERPALSAGSSTCGASRLSLNEVDLSTWLGRAVAGRPLVIETTPQACARSRCSLMMPFSLPTLRDMVALNMHRPRAERGWSQDYLPHECV